MDSLAGAVFGLDAARRHATSALPDAPVVPEPVRRSASPGPVRRRTAGTLRYLAHRLDSRPLAAR